MVQDYPAALRMLEYDSDRHWMVSKYHAAGSLSKRQGMFKGKVYEALQALRPIVDLVAKLHQQRIVHRDIKLQNILVNSSGELVLGDFGIVFLDAENRPTEILERVGSRDWMAPWAQTGMRVDDVNPSFDVFPLGKLIWTMISGQPMLPYWYYERPQYDLTRLFPNDPNLHIVNRILNCCVVEHEADCLPDAGALLSMLDEFLSLLGNGGQLLGDGLPRPCRICGVGYYQIAPGRFPLPGGSRHDDCDVYACDYCDHIQFFGRSKPPSKPAVFDAVTDFTLQPNPTWAYGYCKTLDGKFCAHTKSRVDPDYTGVEMWHSPEVERDNGVKHNSTGVVIKGKTGTFDIPPDMLHMHPGENRGYAVVRWTCPRSGQYRVEGLFCGLDSDTTGADVDVHALLNSRTRLLDRERVLRGVGSDAAVGPRVVRLVRGNTIDFIVGVGPSGSNGSDSTGLKATIAGIEY